jgi:hypothetical protein
MSAYKIDYSTELMSNYLQAEIMRPESGIQALQASTGSALLFSIGTDNSLYATVEETGKQSHKGWRRCNLSQAQTIKDFRTASGATCTSFAAAQCTDQSIHLAMVLRESANDHLYLCLSNSATDTSWIDHPAWVAYPYDDPNHARATLRIARVFLSEASDNQYIVVDVIRDPGTPVELIFRYYIDPTKTNGTAWQPHDVAIDIEAAAYASCLGRKAGQDSFPVDGIYTSGTVGGKAQFVYAPLYNVFDPTIAPNPDVLHLPGGVVPDAIAACRNSDNTSDLYTAASGALYHFASTNQENDATGVLVARNDLFNRVRSLFAFQSGTNQVTVWGLNANDQIFYTTCALDKLQSADAWSVPVPILAGVEQVTPYANRAYSANCFFAHTGENKLVKAVKSPHTLMWTFREITLPPPSTSLPAQKFSSYTTRVQVTDAAGQPASKVHVSISASNVTSVYINHIYYVISPTPIEVNPDVLGTLTIVESVDTLTGTQLTIGAADASVKINPMDKPIKAAAGLTTEGQLRGATIHYLDGTTKPLVAPQTSSPNLQLVANGNQQVSHSYTSMGQPARPPLALQAASMPAAVPADHILVDAGDFFAWLGHEIDIGIENFAQFIEDTAKGVWSIVIKIGEKTYQALLNTVEAVVSAATWLYNAIKTAAKDLISFLEYLFDPADLMRTKEVIKNTVKLFLKYQADQIEVVKGDFDSVIKSAEAAVNKWAGVGSWSGLGDTATSRVNAKATPPANQSAPGALLQHHYQGNAGNWSWKSAVTEPTAPPGPIAALISAIESEGATIELTIERLRGLAENFATMSLEDVLKQLLAIVVDLGLESVRNVVDALFDIVHSLIDGAITLLDTPIYIPVLSDILKEFGVSEFSFLDIACWVAAVPANLLFKAIHGATPFPDDEFTKFLITTTDFMTLSAAFQKAGSPPAQAVHPAQSTVRPVMAMAVPPKPTPQGGKPLILPTIPLTVAPTLLTIGLAAGGVSAVVLSFLSVGEANGPSDNPFAKPSAVFGILAGALPAAAGVLVPFEPVQNEAVSTFSKVVSVIRICLIVAFSGPVSSTFPEATAKPIGKLKVEDYRGIGAIVDAFLVLPALFVTIWHFVELAQKPAAEAVPRDLQIIYEVSNCTSYISRISYAVAVNSPEPVTKVATAILVGALNACGGLLLLGGTPLALSIIGPTITASTTNTQAAATPITPGTVGVFSRVGVFITGANNAVALPKATAGSQVTINPTGAGNISGNTPLNVYPLNGSGDTINGRAANTSMPITLPASSPTTFFSSVTGAWQTK